MELTGRRRGSDCVECERVLYFVVHTAADIPDPDLNSDAICTYNESSGSLDADLIELPCQLTCVRLMKMKGKVVMVGGVQRQGKWTMEGIRVWVLEGRRWARVVRMPDEMWRDQLDDMDQVFSSSGFSETVYIQGIEERELAVFEMGLGMCRWAEMRRRSARVGF